MNHNMKKLLLLTLLLTAFICNAQDDWKKPVVFIADAVNAGNCPSNAFSRFESEVKSGVNKSVRVQVIDENTQKILAQEQARLTEGSGGLSAAGLYRTVKSLGANYVVEARLNSMSDERVIPKESTSSIGKILDTLAGTDPYYKATINWSLTVVNVDTGETAFSQSFNTDGRSTTQSDTRETAYSDALDDIAEKVQASIDGCVPLVGTILKIETTDKKNKKAETVILDLGTRKGLTKSSSVKVYIKTDIAGEIATTEIGTLKVKEVLSPNRSLCEVKKGKEEVLEAFNKQQDLVVVAY